MREFRVTQKLMGTIFTLGVVSENDADADIFLKAGVQEIERLEALLSEFIPDSIVSKINRQASSNWVKADAETYGLLKRCVAISRLCKGDFDITVAPLKSLFNFKNAAFEMPDKVCITDALKKVGYEKLLFDDDLKVLKFAIDGMKISLAAIGKGYAADSVITKWKKWGVSSGFVSASGDIRVMGRNGNNEHWKAGIANPDIMGKTLLRLPLQDNAIATSGNSEQYFLWKNQRWSHNINPHTGIPLQGIKSVTVVAPGAELSDALATAIYVKGVEKGLVFVNQLPQTHAVIIDEKNNIHFSKDLVYETVTDTAYADVFQQLR